MNPFRLDQLSRLTIRNCIGHWRYSIVTALVVGIGLIAVWLFRGYLLKVEDLYREHYTARMMFGQIMIETDGAGEAVGIPRPAMSKEQQEAVQRFVIQEAGDVKQLVRFLSIDGQLNLGNQSSVFSGLAYDLVTGEDLRGKKWAWNAVAGRPLKARGEVIIGRNMAELLGCTYDAGAYLAHGADLSGYRSEVRAFNCSGAAPGRLTSMISASSEKGQLNGAYFDVVGLMAFGYRDVDRTWLMMSLEDGQKLLATDRVSWISLATNSRTQDATLVAKFERFSQKHELGLKAFVWNEHPTTDIYRRTMIFLRTYEGFVMAILVGIVSIAVFNLMVKVVQERRHEIGLLRALGYRTRDLVRLFLGESCLNAAAGIVCGSVVGVVIALGLNDLGILYRAGVLSEPVSFSIALSVHQWLASAGLLFALVFGASVLALWQTLRLKVIDCLMT